MSKHEVLEVAESGCLICGEDLRYGERRPLSCLYCGEEHVAEVSCRDGHFICDSCHALPAGALIETTCRATALNDPMQLAIELMRDPRIKMHGPEHHFLVPAVLLTAASNLREEQGLKAQRLEVARDRAAQVKGGFCGHHGTCGAGVGAGIFVSVLLGATPLSEKEWQLASQATVCALSAIAAQGGPRCCKRDTFLAIRETVGFARRELGIAMPCEGEVGCHFHARNRECQFARCPFYPHAKKSSRGEDQTC